jgi:hypothetical protein
MTFIFYCNKKKSEPLHAAHSSSFVRLVQLNLNRSALITSILPRPQKKNSGSLVEDLFSSAGDPPSHEGMGHKPYDH